MNKQDIVKGMKVKIIKWNRGYRPNHWNSSGTMDHWRGKVVTIKSYTYNQIRIEEDIGDGSAKGWSWKITDFKPIELWLEERDWIIF